MLGVPFVDGPGCPGIFWGSLINDWLVFAAKRGATSTAINLDWRNMSSDSRRADDAMCRGRTDHFVADTPHAQSTPSQTAETRQRYINSQTKNKIRDI